MNIYICINVYKSARTVGAKGRVFPEALTQSALAGGGGVPFFAGKMHGTFIKHRNLQHFEAPIWHLVTLVRADPAAERREYMNIYIYICIYKKYIYIYI